MQVSKIQIAALMLGTGLASAAFTDLWNYRRVQAAVINEAQASGLESECKAQLPTFTSLGEDRWKLEHIPMPACKDGLKRTVDIPERDEVDALTVNCGVEDSK